MPWLAARGDLPVTASSERLIGKELIGEYFKAVKEKYHMDRAPMPDSPLQIENCQKKHNGILGYNTALSAKQVA